MPSKKVSTPGGIVTLPRTDYPKNDREIGLLRERRPSVRFVSSYDPALALIIIERIAGGGLVTKICAEEGMPAVATFIRWTVEQPDLGDAYRRAVEMSARMLEEEAITLARDAAYAEVPPSALRMKAIDTLLQQLRWSASKRSPREFGERAGASVVVPIQINTTLDLGAGAREGDAGNIYTLEAPSGPPPVVAAVKALLKTKPESAPSESRSAKPRPPLPRGPRIGRRRSSSLRSSKLKTPDDMPAVLVVWADAAMAGGWRSRGDIDLDEIATPVQSVGWLFSDTREGVVLGASWSCAGVGNLTFIPRGMIKRVTPL